MNKFALVTGTTSGIGEAVARQLLERGWQVLGIARRPANVEHASYTHCSFDLADKSLLIGIVGPRVESALRSRTWDRVALINNAALTGQLGWAAHLDPAQLAVVLAVNVVAPMWLTGFFIEHVPRETPLRIVNLSSGAASFALPGLAAYSASKAALRMSDMVMGAELTAARGSPRERHDTAILTYQPGIVETPMQRTARAADPREFASHATFMGFLESGAVVPPDAPARDIVEFAESTDQPVHAEKRLGA